MASLLHPRAHARARRARGPVGLAAGRALVFATAVALAILDARADGPESGGRPSDTGATSPPLAAPPRELEEIVVTANRRATPLSEVAASVTVLDLDTIQLDASFEVLELLRDVPGFQIVQTGSRGGTTSLFVRGAESDHNLVLVDGIRINRGGGAFDFSNLSVGGIDRIEIVRGPGAALYGSDAISSVIHVITKRGQGPLTGSVQALVGSDRTHEINGGFSGGTENIGYSLNLSRYATNGINGLNNDSESSSFRGRLDHRLMEGLDLSLGSTYVASGFDFPTDFVSNLRGGFPLLDRDQGRDSFEWYNGLTLRFEPSERLLHQLLVGYTRSRFNHFDGASPILFFQDGVPTFTGDNRETKRRGREARTSVDYQLLYDMELTPDIDARFVLDLEYERERFEQADQLVTFDTSPVEAALPSPPPGSLSLPALAGTLDAFSIPREQLAALEQTRSTSFQREDRRNRAGLLQVGLDLYDRVFLNASARIDDNSEFGSVLTGSASIAYVVPGTDTKLRLGYSKGFKEPSFRDSFGPSGNPDLSPETSRSFEGGIEQPFPGGRIGFTYFRTDFDDLITFVGALRVGTETVGRTSNVQGARNQGLEVELRLAATDWLSLGGNYTILRTRVRDSGGLDARGDDIGGTAFMDGEELLRRPRYSGSAFAEARGEGWETRLSATHFGSRTDRDFGAAGDGLRLRQPDYFVVDVSARYRLWSSTGSEVWGVLRLNNALDESYEEALGFRAPGRRLLAGVELRRD